MVPIPPQEHGFPTSQGQALQLKGLKGGRGHSHQPLKWVWKQVLLLGMVLRTRERHQVVGPGPLHCEACIQHFCNLERKLRRRKHNCTDTLKRELSGPGVTLFSQSPSPNPKVQTNQLSSHTG